MTRLGGHALDKYTTGTLLGTSAGRGWSGLLAERWRNSEGDLGEVEVRDTEIIVMIDGTLPIRRRGDGKLELCHAVPGTVWLCPDGVREDMIRLYGEVRESIHLFLPASSLSAAALGEIGVDPDKVGLRYEGGFRDPLIEQIARAIRAEMLDPAPGGKMLVETLASALGVHILRHRSSLNPASVVLPEARGALDPRRLRRVMDLIEAHPAEELTVERLAAEACLSPFHFARAFRAATGAAPHRYLADRRIARAGTPVADGAVSIVEFAARCGFPSQAAFPRWFTRFAGAPPGDYRRGRLHVGLSAGSGARPRGRSTVGLTVERDGGVATIGPSGRLDTAAADGFADALRDAIAKTERAVILDCRDLDFISSAGLRVVLMAAKDLRTRGAWLVLCALSPPVRQAFRTTGFDRFMPIYENAADARAALEG